MSDPKGTLKTYIGDMHALESHIFQAIDKQVKATNDHPEVQAKLKTYATTLETHLTELDARLKVLGGSATKPIKEGVSAILGIAAGAIDAIRSEEISKDFRDDYTAVNLSVISYIMLHTTALALGDQETANLAKKNLKHNADFVMYVNAIMPQVVLWELKKDNLPVQESALSTAKQTVHDVWQGGSSSTNYTGDVQ